MEQPKFFTGQTVKLKSGGPVMTVMGTPVGFGLGMNQDVYVCQWFAGKTYKQAQFPGANLKLASPEETPKRVIARKPRGMYLGR